jgi:hypothetical protein
MVVWEDASTRKFGWLSILELIASAKMNAAVAVRKSSPTKTPVFLVDMDRGPHRCLVGASIFDLIAMDIWVSLLWLVIACGTSTGRHIEMAASTPAEQLDRCRRRCSAWRIRERE